MTQEEQSDTLGQPSTQGGNSHVTHASPREVEDRKTAATLVGHFLGSQPFNIGTRMSLGGPVLPWLTHLCLLGLNLFQTLLLMCRLQMGTWHGHLPSTSTRIKLCAAAAADLQQPNKEFRVESRNKALCAQREKLAGRVFR